MALGEYKRVLPRDLFNEAKLLKCLGRLTLLIEDGMAPPTLVCKYGGDAFDIRREDDGHIWVINMFFSIKGKTVAMKTPLNSRCNYPLLMEHEDYSETIVFNENGEFTEEFLEFCKQ